MWVMIDVNNSNILVSLAYIKANDNPLGVFCNYILYVLLKSSKESLINNELVEGLHNEFGLKMPQHVINNCISMLKKSGEVKILPAGAGYTIGKTSFSLQNFEKTMLRLHEQEDKIINSLVDFVKSKYKISWSIEQAKLYLSSFLDEEGYGAQLFLREPLKLDPKCVTPSLYIGRYITSLQSRTDCIELKYLEEIVNGMMIYQGIYQTNDYQQDKSQKYRGTIFYLDTKLILRALGFSWNAQVSATRELVRLIIDKYEGKIGILEHTLEEVERALFQAGKAFQAGRPISDTELNIFAELNPTKASLMIDTSSSVLALLKEEFNVEAPPPVDWNSKEVQKYVIDVKSISEFILSKRRWRFGTVKNDVDNINQINILRKGNYRSRYGGRDKLPVFVTSNIDLVYTFRRFVSECTSDSDQWNVHNLPIISDNMILFRLWVPFANEYSNLPAITLSRYANAAQNETTQFFEKVRALATEYKSETGIDVLDLSEARRLKLEDILIEKTSGDSDLLTEDMVATSVDELVKMENLSLHTRVDELERSLNTSNRTISEKDSRIVILAAKPFVNKIGIRRWYYYIAKFWWIPAALMLYFLATEVTNYFEGHFPSGIIAACLPVIIEIILFVIDKFCDDNDWRHLPSKRAVVRIWRWYSKKVASGISLEEQPYLQEIMEYCLNHTPLFYKHKRYLIASQR